MYPSAIEAVHCDSADATDSIIENCRLSKLNFDCLEKIFEYLFTNDLIQLCHINPMVCDAIKERTISKHRINFMDWNQIWSTETIFAEIGAHIRYMAIHELNFDAGQPINHFLAKLIEHCTPNRIQELALRFDFNAMDETLLNAARPYFSQLQKLTFGSIGRRSNTDGEQLLAAMIDSAKQLSSIQLENTSSNGNWLRSNHMKNVENLTLVKSSVVDDENLHHYLTNQPKLKTFVWINSHNPNYTLCENVARYCSELERFVDVQYHVDEEYLQRNFVMSRYNYFASFQNLKNAHITAYTESGRDLIGAFMALAQRNTVEMLGIHFLKNATTKYTLDDMDNAAEQYPDILSLKYLDIENCTSCGFWSGILVNFLKRTMNLNELSISGHDQLNSIQLTCIVLAPPQLNVLKINRLNVKDLPLALKSISIVRVSFTALKVCINSEQSMQLGGREFQNMQFEVIE